MSIYDEVKQEMGAGPAWPSRPAFTTYYGYASGVPLGSFSTERDAQLAGATVTGKSFDEAGYKTARQASGDHERAVHEEWQRRVRAEHPEVNDAVFALVLAEAWERGHSAGYGEVELDLDDLVTFAVEIIKAA